MPKTTPIRFPYCSPISDMSKKFILKCLEYEEHDRPDWKDIFKMEIFTKSV